MVTYLSFYMGRENYLVVTCDADKKHFGHGG